MRRLLVLVAMSLAVACAESPHRPAARDITNRQLSPELAQYMVGALSFVASAAEIEQYVHLRDDAEATLRAKQAQYDAAVQNVKNLRADIDAANATMKLAERQLRDTSIRAPFDGYIQKRTV